MFADVLVRVVDAIREVDGVVTLRPPDAGHPHLIRVVTSRPPLSLTGDLIERVERAGVHLRYVVYGPAPAPWTRIYVLDDADRQYTISVTFSWG